MKSLLIIEFSVIVFIFAGHISADEKILPGDTKQFANCSQMLAEYLDENCPSQAEKLSNGIVKSFKTSDIPEMFGNFSQNLQFLKNTESSPALQGTQLENILQTLKFFPDAVASVTGDNEEDQKSEIEGVFSNACSLGSGTLRSVGQKGGIDSTTEKQLEAFVDALEKAVKSQHGKKRRHHRFD